MTWLIPRTTGWLKSIVHVRSTSRSRWIRGRATATPEGLQDLRSGERAGDRIDDLHPVEEMQNYANWFTYYRHRLFAAIAVTSQAAADLKGDLSAIRLGYGRINYSDNGRRSMESVRCTS